MGNGNVIFIVYGIIKKFICGIKETQVFDFDDTLVKVHHLFMSPIMVRSKTYTWWYDDVQRKTR